MTFVQGLLRQEATWWPIKGRDGFGGVEFASPRVIKCRWVDDEVLFADSAGNEKRSRTVVTTAEPLETEGYVALGWALNYMNPLTAPGARKIEGTRGSAVVDGRFAIFKAYL